MPFYLEAFLFLPSRSSCCIVCDLLFDPAILFEYSGDWELISLLNMNFSVIVSVDSIIWDSYLRQEHLQKIIFISMPLFLPRKTTYCNQYDWNQIWFWCNSYHKEKSKILTLVGVYDHFTWEKVKENSNFCGGFWAIFWGYRLHFICVLAILKNERRIAVFCHREPLRWIFCNK